MAEPSVLKHGTYFSYVRGKCRCDLCRAANTNYSRVYRKNKKAAK